MFGRAVWACPEALAALLQWLNLISQGWRNHGTAGRLPTPFDYADPLKDADYIIDARLARFRGQIGLVVPNLSFVAVDPRQTWALQAASSGCSVTYPHDQDHYLQDQGLWT
jgi:hypothetical protein